MRQLAHAGRGDHGAVRHRADPHPSGSAGPWAPAGGQALPAA